MKKSYLIFSLLWTFLAMAQAPGGVSSGLRMWLNASEESSIVKNSNNRVQSWKDISGIGTVYVKRPQNVSSPLYKKADVRTNFHPTLVFSSSEDYLITSAGPMSVANPARSAFYTVVNHDFARDRSYFLSFGSHTPNASSRRPVFGVYSSGNQGLARIRSASATNSSAKLFNPGATTIAGYHWDLGNTIEFEFDAHRETVRHRSTSSQMNGLGMLGAGSLTDSYLLGVMPEVIAYQRQLNDQEKSRINSYLGLKYGITLDLNKTSTTVNYNYLFSDGTMIWEGNNQINRNYHNNVASVIRDSNGGLYNRQSRSTDTGAIVHMGVGTKLGEDPILGSITNDKSAITWGHNNQPVSRFSFAGNQQICGAMDSKLNGRIWLVDKVNFDQEVLVSAYGSSFPYNGANHQVFLLIADSPAKIQANNWDQVVPMAFVDGKHVVNYKFKNKLTYFTFASKVVGTCDGCEFSGIKGLDFTRYNWERGSKGPKNFNLGNNFNVLVSVLDPNNVLTNRYPRASSQKTLRERRRNGAGTITTKIEFKNNAGAKRASATSFELFDIDRQGNVLDEVKVVGYCNGSEIYPTINYMYNRSDRSRYTFDNEGNLKAKPRGIRYNGNSGYTNKRGRAYVEFENPVEEIRIIYTPKILNNSRGASYIGIGPMEFYCPAPLPTPNEDGLVFTKQGPTNVKTCEVVDYVFRAINTNCAPKEVTFSDVLPNGMVWVNDSFSAGGIDIPDSNITGYGTNTLTVSGLLVPGGASTFTFRASAIFVESAPAGAYRNRAKLSYLSLGNQVALESKDRLTGENFTITNATLSPDRSKQVTTKFSIDQSCFQLNKELEITLEINNPNAISFKQMFLALDFEDGPFKFVPGSMQTSNGLNIGTNQGDEDGNLEFDDFDLPPGISWVKYKVKSSNNLANYEIDPLTSNPVEYDFSFELFSEFDDECLESVFVNANGEIELEFCTVCYYPPVSGNNGDILNSTGFLAYTSLQRTNNNWIGARGNAFVVLESYTKGFVLTRLTTQQINNLKPIQGMLVYDITVNCIKLFDGEVWGCLEQACVDE